MLVREITESLSEKQIWARSGKKVHVSFVARQVDVKAELSNKWHNVLFQYPSLIALKEPEHVLVDV